MTTYVLIIIILSGNSAATTAAHFYTERSCNDAKEVVIEAVKYMTNIHAMCVRE